MDGQISGSYTECGGTYTESWSFTDECDRTITHSRTITVEPASQAAFATPLPGDITIACGQAPPSGTPLAYTNGESGECLIEGSVDGQISGSYTECGGTYTESWSFTDECDRTITHSRTITVEPASQAAFATPLPGDITIACGQAPPSGTPLAYTNGESGECLIEGSVDGQISGSYTECGGTYTESWSFTDECDRTITHSRTITVEPASQAAFATPLPGDITIACGQAPPSGTPLAYTNGESGECLIEGSVDGQISGSHTSCGGTYTESWSFTDECDRTITHSRTITVEPAPLPTFTCPDDTDILCFVDLEAQIVADSTALANSVTVICDLMYEIEVTRPAFVDNCNDTEYEVTYQVIDECPENY